MRKPQPLQLYLEALGSDVRAVCGNIHILIDGATSDSRDVKPGWLFVAIPGSRVDGTQFVRQALDAGAAAIVAERSLNLPSATCCIQVQNAYRAAGRIAEAAYGWPARNMHIIAITGTNGKTTCAYLLRDILRHSGARTGMIGTVQYDIGDQILTAGRTTPTPFELQAILNTMRDAGMHYVVMEVSSHALHQYRPGKTPFCAGLFTNLTGDHCDYHKSMENYFAAKSILFTEYLANNSPAVINGDDPYGRRLLDIVRRDNRDVCPIQYGTAAAADVRIDDYACSLTGVRLSLALKSERIEIESPIPGRFSVYNIAAAAATALTMGFSSQAVTQAIRTFRGAPGRLQPVCGRHNIRALVDYAHTDDALLNVLEALRDMRPKQLVIVFGCGGDRDRTKRPRMGAAAARFADRLYVTSDNPRSEDPQRIICDILDGIPDNTDTVVMADRRRAIRQAVFDAAPGTLILVAGKGHETYQEIGACKHPFNDVLEVEDAMRERGLLEADTPQS